MNKEIVQTLIAVRKEALRILDRQLIVVSLNFQYQVSSRTRVTTSRVHFIRYLLLSPEYLPPQRVQQAERMTAMAAVVARQCSLQGKVFLTQN
jgi:hypothetical protein